LYHQLISQLQAGRGVSQQLLFPEQLRVSPDEQPLLDALLPELELVGFRLENTAPGEYDITALPSVLGNQNAETALRAIMSHAADRTTDISGEMQKHIALTLAQSAAMPMGKTMSEQQMQAMLQQLFALPSYRITPDGKTVVVLLTQEEIARRF
jgi:DNA mismatch repair protein MutL